MASMLKRIFRGKNDRHEEEDGKVTAVSPPQSRRLFGSRRSSVSDGQPLQSSRRQSAATRPRSLHGPTDSHDYHDLSNTPRRPLTADPKAPNRYPIQSDNHQTNPRNVYTHLEHSTIRPVHQGPPEESRSRSLRPMENNKGSSSETSWDDTPTQNVSTASSNRVDSSSTQTTTTTTTTTRVPIQQSQYQNAVRGSSTKGTSRPLSHNAFHSETEHIHQNLPGRKQDPISPDVVREGTSRIPYKETDPLEHSFRNLTLSNSDETQRLSSSYTSPLSKSNSISRKPIPASASVTRKQSLPADTRSRHDSVPLPVAEPQQAYQHSSGSGIAGNVHVSHKENSLSPQEVIARAKTNSADTTIAEKVAPAVFHEMLNEHVHEIRNEVTTREIHNHEYHHRILPIIDVEVLPTRHFLPIAGGGLVEVNSEDVPGRGRNWIVAETASKIPSNTMLNSEKSQPRQFTARTFAPQEGDFKRSVTAEGFERTEQTWIHQPEPERGGYLTQQTWPLDFSEVESRTSRT